MTIRGVFVFTSFFSALLLFSVQPVVGKMLLPALGGAPMVWNTCLVFFQLSLLAGYLYAHGLATRPRRWHFVHALLLLAGGFVLPIAFDLESVSTTNAPVAALLAALIGAVALPFIAVSATSPLIQHWFAGSRHRTASDPYYLYAASNVGSMGALIAYPVVFEPWFDVSTQSAVWAWGYAGLAVLLAGAFLLARPAANTPHIPTKFVTGARGEVARLVALAAVPSALLLAVTTTITVDVAAVPFLWVAPLVLFLGSFVLVFAEREWLPTALIRASFPVALIGALSVVVLKPQTAAILQIGSHLLLFFVVCMLFHGEIARRRPAPAQLTGYYLAMSVGGAIGGMFVTFVAPAIFLDYWEYPLLLVVCATFAPVGEAQFGSRKQLAVIALVGAAVHAVWAALAFEARLSHVGAFVGLGLAVSPLVYLVCGSRKRLAFGAAVAVIVGLGSAYRTHPPKFMARSFFSSHRVVSEGDRTVLYHGNTDHGAQSTLEEIRDWSLPYHHPHSPSAEVFEAARTLGATTPVAVAGLGVGGLACHASPGQQVTFFEIDPVVVHIAENPEFFTFLRDCPGRYDVVLGDARMRLREVDHGRFSAVILDAFSSDSIPVHLVTIDAAREYIDALSEGGVLAFHVSNRYIDLRPMLGSMAVDLGLAAYTRTEHRREIDGVEVAPTTFVAFVTSGTAPASTLEAKGWQRLPKSGVRPWTDARSNLLGVVGGTGSPGSFAADRRGP